MKLRLLPLSLCCILLIFAINAPVSAASTKIFESHDNKKVIYGYLDHEVVYIPIGEIWRQLELKLSVDAKEKMVYFFTDQGTVTLWFQSDIGVKNGKIINLTHPTKNFHDKVYVSAEDVAGLFGVKNTFLDESKLEIARDKKKLLIQIKPVESAYLYQPKKIDVLMYHHFDAGHSDSVTVTPERFREHLDALIQAGYETITEEDLYQYKTNPQYRLPEKPLLITIDDGYESNYSIAYPILKDKGLRATIYVITSYRGQQPGQLRHFGWEEAKEMYDSGVINIESHTHNLHHYVTQGKTQKAAILARKADEDEASYKKRILDDLKTSRDLIRQYIGKESISLAYPYGVYDETVMKLAKEAGFKLHVTIKAGKNLRNDKLLIYRTNVDGSYSGKQLIAKLGA